MTTEKDVKDSIDQKLIDAGAALNLEQVQKLLKQGANPKYIRHSNTNGWYSGDTSTALYLATHANFKQKGGEKNYVNVLEVLLKAGSDPNFKATRGSWNHSTDFPLFSNIYYNLNNLSDPKEKIRFIQLFVKHGVNINQPQTHGRSKNWRGYRNSTCFIFQAMNGCGVSSKIEELKQIYNTVDYDKLLKQKQEQLKKQFVKQFPQFSQLVKQEEQQQEQTANQQAKQKQKQKKVPQVAFIEALLNFGVNPESFTSQSYWQNYENENYAEGEYQLYSKYDQRINQMRETILHRVIMNNLVGLVKLLIEKGAKVETKLKFTITSPIYPHEWPQKVKQKRRAKVIESLKQYEEQKAELLQQLKGQLTEQDKNDIQTQLKNYSYEIFKAKRYNIENQPPQPIYEVKQLSCLEVAQALKVSPEIIQLIKHAQLKVKSK